MNVCAYAAAAAFLLATSAPALAQDSARELAVSYDDLDLTKDQGVARLKQRVRAAVQDVCREDDPNLKQQIRQKGCARRSSASALEAVGRAVNRANQAQARADSPGPIAIAR